MQKEKASKLLEKFDYTLARMKFNYGLKNKIVQKAWSLKSINLSTAFKSITYLCAASTFSVGCKMKREREEEKDKCVLG